MKTHEVELCYAWQETEEGVYHAFEVVDAEQSVDYDTVAEKLAGLLDTTTGDERFNWRSMRVSLPETTVNRILADADRITVKTPLGDIVAEASTDSDNPGVWVSLHQDGEDYEPTLALVEYTATEADREDPQLITRVWGDGQQEDYTDRVVHTGLETEGANEPEILFRGKRVDNGEWVYGYYANCAHPRGPESETRHYIISYPGGVKDYHEIYTATVGRYTGLTGKNGVKIFEDDIVHAHDITLQCSKPHHEFDGYVDFSSGMFRVLDANGMEHFQWPDYELEVIGNIHDNPELLEGGGET